MIMAILLDAWNTGNMRTLIRWVLFIPLQVLTWHIAIGLFGRDMEAALCTWFVGFMFMILTEPGSK